MTATSSTAGCSAIACSTSTDAKFSRQPMNAIAWNSESPHIQVRGQGEDLIAAEARFYGYGMRPVVENLART